MDLTNSGRIGEEGTLRNWWLGAQAVASSAVPSSAAPSFVIETQHMDSQVLGLCKTDFDTCQAEARLARLKVSLGGGTQRVG